MSARDTSRVRAVRSEPVIAPPPGPTVARLIVQQIAFGLGLLGVDGVAVLRRCDLDEAALKRLPERVPFALVVRLFAAMHAVTGEQGFGLRFAAQVLPETWEMLGYVVRSSGTLGDALLRAGRYLRLISDATELSLHVEGKRALLLYRNPYPELALPEITEFVLAVIAIIGRHLSGRNVVPLEVRFTHAEPDDTTLHTQLFGAPVRFRRPHDGLVLDEAVLHLPIGSHDPRLCTLLERQAEQLLARLPEPRRFTRAVQDLLTSEIESGNSSADRVAAHLGLHPKTLRRRLQAEGTSHRRLLESVRRDLAERYLTVSDKTVSEMAFMLGYADPSAFHKAFRRWTGIAPDVYRRRARLAPAR